MYCAKVYSIHTLLHKFKKLHVLIMAIHFICMNILGLKPNNNTFKYKQISSYLNKGDVKTFKSYHFINKLDLGKETTHTYTCLRH